MQFKKKALFVVSCLFLLHCSVVFSSNKINVEDDVQTIANTLGVSKSWVNDMMVDRQGLRPNANMTTIGLHRSIDNKVCYFISSTSGLIETPCTKNSIIMEDYISSYEQSAKAPDHSLIFASWLDDEVNIEGGEENVLGDNSILQISSSKKTIYIPVLEATDKDLLYYGAMLLEDGEIVKFPNSSYPIWLMELGRYYVDCYLMTNKGKGFYLEYHNDQPHWHQPLSNKSSGFLLLAKKVGVNENNEDMYHLTGFTIPYGKAIYSKMGAIHADPGLYGGKWAVGYTESSDFTTGLLRNIDFQMMKVSSDQ